MVYARTLLISGAALVGSLALFGCRNELDRGDSMAAQDSINKTGITPGSTGTASDPGVMRTSGAAAGGARGTDSSGGEVMKPNNGMTGGGMKSSGGASQPSGGGMSR